MDKSGSRRNPSEEECRNLEESNRNLEREVNLLKSENQEFEYNLNALKKKADSLGPAKGKITTIRRNLLEGRYDVESSARKATDRRINTDTAGNILIDCFVLQAIEQENSPTLKRCRRKFEEMYGVESDIIRKAVQTAPSDVIAVYNHRANGRFMGRWSAAENRKKLAQKLEERSSKAINHWETWVKNGKDGTPPGFEELTLEARELHVRLRMLQG